MKHILIAFLLSACFPFSNYGQSIFSNVITGTNPGLSNLFTTGQVTDANITVSGIGKAPDMFGAIANDRYNAKSWKVNVTDPDSYFEFVISPKADHKIDFASFKYSVQRSPNGPTLFAFRSSADGFTSDIGTVTATGSAVQLSANAFQNITAPITFRIYGWAAVSGTGTFSINTFEFDGTVSCIIPEKPVLPETNLGCTSASFVLNWPSSLQASSYFLDVATDAGFVNRLAGYQNKDLGSVLSETITVPKAGGTYYVQLQAGNSCAVSDYSNPIKVAPPETVYNGTWSNGFPDATMKAAFSSNFNIVASLEACSCQIDNNVAVHVDEGVVVKLENELDVQGSGTLTFENNSSLIQLNDKAVNKGSIIYKRTSQPMNNFDYTYWSSPVEGQTFKKLVPNTLPDKYFSFGTTYWENELPDNIMAPGKGYIIRRPKPGEYKAPFEESVPEIYAQPVQFIGTPNNGYYELEVNTGKYNLIGNPYPSALSADEFLQANTSQIEGTLYFWTHNTAVSNTGYASADYASYNLVGGVKTAAKSAGLSFPGSTGGEAPSGDIAAGQSFFALCKGTNPVIFKNSMRVGQAGKNSHFYKGFKSKATVLDKSRIWLNMTNSGGAFKQLLIGYVTGATNGHDPAFDGETFDGNTFIDFYSINENKNLVIQGRGLPFDPNDTVPLGYKTSIEGTFEISIDKVDGSFANREVFLEDKNTGAVHNLKESPYSFSTLKGEYKDRFVLRYVSSPNLAVNNPIFKNAEEQLQITVKQNNLHLKSENENVSEVYVYDLKGDLLYQNKQIGKREMSISNLMAQHQVLIVKTVFANASKRTDKVIL